MVTSQYGLWSLWSPVNMACGRYGHQSIWRVVVMVTSQYGLWSLWSPVNLACGRYGHQSIWPRVVMVTSQYGLWSLWPPVNMTCGRHVVFIFRLFNQEPLSDSMCYPWRVLPDGRPSRKSDNQQSILCCNFTYIICTIHDMYSVSCFV